MEDNKKVKLTKEGYQDLINELEDLETNQKQKNIEAIADARGQGDLSENADYSAAREEQGRIYQRIGEIKEILKHYEIIDTKIFKIVLNGRIEKQVEIVGKLEADPLNNKISDESPLGKAIKSLNKGEEKDFDSETGKKINVKIVDIL